MSAKSRKPNRPTAIEVAPPAADVARAEVAAAVAATGGIVEDASNATAGAASAIVDASVDAAESVTAAATPPVAEAVQAAADVAEAGRDATIQAAKAVTETTTDAANTLADAAGKTAADAAQGAADAASAATATVADTVNEDMTMATQFDAKSTVNEISDRAQGAFDKGGRVAADFADFGKGNVEALVESTRIAARGAEEILKYSTDYARQTVEKGNETARRMASVKSPVEFFQLQSELTKGFVEAVVSEGAKFSENYLKLVSETVQPLSNRFAVAAEKVRSAA